jgi:hypothetical protein
VKRPKRKKEKRKKNGKLEIRNFEFKKYMGKPKSAQNYQINRFFTKLF